MIEAQTMEEINATPSGVKEQVLCELRKIIKMQDVKDIKKALKELRDKLQGENENV